MSQNDMSEEDYLKRHLQDLEDGKKSQNFINSDIPLSNPNIDNNRASDLQYFNFDVKE